MEIVTLVFLMLNFFILSWILLIALLSMSTNSTYEFLYSKAAVSPILPEPLHKSKILIFSFKLILSFKISIIFSVSYLGQKTLSLRINSLE